MCNRILLIDDEKIIRDALEKRLIVDGYEVCVAEDGLYGLSLLEKKEKDDAGFFDIVILNVEMPKMSGVDVLRLIKEKYANVEVIVTTNIKSVDIAIKVLRLGAFDYIQKPIEYNKLSLAILSAIEKKEKNQKSKVAEKAMRSNEGKCRSIVEHASDGIAIIQDNLFKYVNPQFEQLMGCSEDLLLETSLFKYVHPNFLDKMMDYFIYDKIGNHQTVMITNSGNEVKIELNTSEIMYGERKAQLVIFRDVTERKKTEDKMEFLTFHDKLTGLYNRAFFDEEIKRLDTNRQLPLSIIMADLNSLKLTNDGLGHLVGDELIIQAANALKRACRAEEIISRWGGDEFVILLPKVSEDDANAICERINEKCESISNLPIKVSMALGTASKTTATQNIENILKEAEDNMYKNKLLNSQNVKNAILVSLKKMLHDKNFGTEGHDLRMKKMCEKLGKKLDLSDSDIHKLVLLAGLHDIGKAAIPIQLLMEPELLTEEDRKEMQNHSAIGFRIANSNSDINQIAEGILYHHERWDGKGYPSGLIGKKIPLEARMVSIVDAYDDMVNDSPYKKAITRDEAIDELRRNKGTKFDPYLVDAFIETILEKD